MKLNMTRRYAVPLPSEQCLQGLQESVNDTANTRFTFPLVGRFSMSIKNQRRFIIFSRTRGTIILEGFIEPMSDGGSQVYIRTMPPLWFVFLFGWAGAFLISFASTLFLVAAGWLFWTHFIAMIHVSSAKKLYQGLDAIFGTLNAVQEPPVPLTRKGFLRKAGLYLLIAVVYILALAVFGFFASYLETASG